MIPYWNFADLFSEIRALYGTLKFYKTYERFIKNPQSAKEHVDETKRELRRKIKKYVNFGQDEKEMTNYTPLCPTSNRESPRQYFKTQFNSIEDARKWCDEYYDGHQICSPYDCTGQWFCSWINFAHMKDDIYLICIQMSRDV